MCAASSGTISIPLASYTPLPVGENDSPGKRSATGLSNSTSANSTDDPWRVYTATITDSETAISTRTLEDAKTTVYSTIVLETSSIYPTGISCYCFHDAYQTMYPADNYD